MTDNELEVMDLDQLAAVVALISGKRIKFTIESREWKGKDKWLVKMYIPHLGWGADAWHENAKWHVIGPTRADALEAANEAALRWADNKATAGSAKGYVQI